MAAAMGLCSSTEGDARPWRECCSRGGVERAFSGELRPISFQVRFELPPEFLLLIRHGTVHQREKHCRDLFTPLHILRRRRLSHPDLRILDPGCRMLRRRMSLLENWESDSQISR